MAAAAALARLEQKQPRARGPTSQDSIRNQGALWTPWVVGQEWQSKACACHTHPLPLRSGLCLALEESGPLISDCRGG